MAAELLQRLAGPQPVKLRRLVKGCGENLTTVLAEHETGDSPAVRSTKALEHAPARRDPIALLRVGDTEHRLGVRHEVTPLLVVKVLAQRAGLRIPDLDKPIDGARRERGAVRGKHGALRVAPILEFEQTALLPHRLLLGARPLQRLGPIGEDVPASAQREQPRGRHLRHVGRDRRSDGSAPRRGRLPSGVELRGVERHRRASQHPRARVLQAQKLLRLRPLRLLQRGATQQSPGHGRLAGLEELQHRLLVQQPQRGAGQARVLQLRKHLVPLSIGDVSGQSVRAVHGVESDGALGLQRAQRGVQALLVQELHDEANHVLRLDLQPSSSRHPPMPTAAEDRAAVAGNGKGRR
eukprot:scaffold7585_cov267-Pinguiococcus_pyrenoidosus.AAC.2